MTTEVIEGPGQKPELILEADSETDRALIRELSVQGLLDSVGRNSDYQIQYAVMTVSEEVI